MSQKAHLFFNFEKIFLEVMTETRRLKKRTYLKNPDIIIVIIFKNGINQ